MIPAALFVLSPLSNSITKPRGVDAVICSESGAAEWAVLGGSEELQVLPEFVPFPGITAGMSELPPGSAAASREGTVPQQRSGAGAGLVGRHSLSLHGSAKGTLLRAVGSALGLREESKWIPPNSQSRVLQAGAGCGCLSSVRESPSASLQAQFCALPLCQHVWRTPCSPGLVSAPQALPGTVLSLADFPQTLPTPCKTSGF